MGTSLVEIEKQIRFIPRDTCGAAVICEPSSFKTRECTLYKIIGFLIGLVLGPALSLVTMALVCMGGLAFQIVFGLDDAEIANAIKSILRLAMIATWIITPFVGLWIGAEHDYFR